jgi:hypothetical protein
VPVREREEVQEVSWAGVREEPSLGLVPVEREGQSSDVGALLLAPRR